ncbi:MAG: hypothetical protein HQL50_15965 [Magnetococcales bacterium]|nr:hypothetical protein [Magnetococcales bacterium]
MTATPQQGQTRGIVDSHVTLEEGIPVRVTLTLSRGGTVEVDPLNGTVTPTDDAKPLKPKKEAWLREIGLYLARVAVMEEREKAQEGGGDAQPLKFEARPDPSVTWWG